MTGRHREATVVDVTATIAACAVVVVALGAGPVRTALPADVASGSLALAAAAVGAAAAILAVIGSRLTGDARPEWVAAALVLYCVVVLPWTAVTSADLAVVPRAARLVAYLGALVLLVLSIRPPRRWGRHGGWVVLGLSVLLALVVLGLPEGPVLRWLVQGPVTTLAVLVGWTVAAAAFVVDGYRRRSRPRTRLGLGLVVMACAQLYRVAVGSPSLDLSFAGLRLVGLAVALVGLAQLVARELGSWESEHWRQEEELAIAALHMERAGELAAERDHELRNGLAGLAGITHLLSAAAGGVEQERIKHAVLAELGRLHTLLDGGTVPGGLAAPADGPPEAYPVAPVLEGLVALRPWATVSVPDGLAARGDAAVLAQVVTNLLANCERHAPGAPVAVSARASGTDVVVEVRDEGPGLPPGAEQAVLARGVRDASAGGSGLGLHISRQLIALQGGTLGLRTATDPRGCVASVTVPAAPPAEATDRSPNATQPSGFHHF